MKPSLILLFSVLGLAVWGLAIVGLLSVTETIASDSAVAAPSRAPVLIAMGTDPSEDDVAGLPPFAGSDPSETDDGLDLKIVEYHSEQQGATLVTEIEYRADAGIDTVSTYFRQLFERTGWTVLESSTVGAATTYAISAGARGATVEIDHADHLIGISIALSEPAPERDQATDR